MAEDIIQQFTSGEYKEGFVTDVEQEFIPKGLNEEIVRRISQRKGEPDWLLEFRLKAYRYWTTLEEPDWGHLEFEKPNYQDIRYLAIPKKKKQPLRAGPQEVGTLGGAASGSAPVLGAPPTIA